MSATRMFDPAYEVKASETVSVFVTEANLTSRGLNAAFEVHNGHLLLGASARIDNDLTRRRIAKSVNEREAGVTVRSIEDALSAASVELRKQLRPTATQAPAAPAITAEERDALFAACKELAEAPDLLERIDKAFERLGVVGEQRNRKLLYLAATARLLATPVCVLVTGPSSAGKSFLLQKLLELLPPSAYVNYTSVSARYLAYANDDLRHRIVVLYEVDGLSDGPGAYMMRSLISENRLQIGTVEKTDTGKIAPRTLAKDGPTALFSSTTEARPVDGELLTRILRCTVTDDPAHSRDILRGIARAKTHSPAPFDVAPYHALQEWLAVAGERRVTIPYATSLAEQVPVATVRIRRDFPQVLSLIAACAILYQAQRDRTHEGAVIATLDDYAIVRELLLEPFTASQQDGLTPEQREAVEAIALLCATPGREGGVSLTEIATHIGRDKSATSRRLVNPLRAGYIQNLNAGLKGRKAAYVPGDPLPATASVLPAQEALTEDGTL